MKIICIEGNYSPTETKNNNIIEPVFFLKPETSISRNKFPFFIPEHSEKIVPRVNLVLKICKLGKNIQEKFAQSYYNEIGIGVDMEASDLLLKCKQNGLPWEPAKAYEASAPLGNFISKIKLNDLNNINFSLLKNGKLISKANSADLLYSFDQIIANVSKYVQIKMGDYIYTGAPELSEHIYINDKIECYIEDKLMLSFNIK
ncbi:MAG: 2-hydroxyhepta-2,4-diene-1,7-dioate isomerase [Bacteroidetes bacterium]|nr:2-hydroxyhepta-2,4-diene-1,7-dioate isomerase [Bacteroidota bacterium]